MTNANPVESLLQLSAAHYVARALHAVADLGIADALDDTPRSTAELAAASGTHPGALDRVLRLLSLYGVFEYAGGVVSHSPSSRLLRQDHPQSMRSLVRMFGLPGLWSAVGELAAAVKTGEPSADRVLPGGIWGYLSQHPDASRIFGEAMTAKAHGAIAGILQAYDFSGSRIIADIGGGRGHLIRAIVDGNPGVSGVLFDQPHVVAEAAGVASDRLRLVGGDFFRDAMPAADTYILMEVIHDWDDEASRKILGNIRRAAGPGAKLLLIELLLPDASTPNWPTTLDIVMLVIGGRQRSLREYSDLFHDAGFAMTRTIDTPAGIAIIEAAAV